MTSYMLTVPDAQYDVLIENVTKESPYRIADKTHIVHSFYLEDNILYADKEELNGQTLKQQVIKMSDAVKLKNSTYKERIRERVKKDYADADEEEIEMHVEFLNELNDSVNRLIAQGIPAKTASAIVNSIVKNHLVNDEEMKETELENMVKSIVEEEVECNSDSSTNVVVNELDVSEEH